MAANSMTGGRPRTSRPLHALEEAPFEMANLYPASTGLPVTVWVSPRGNAQHAARVKVCRMPGSRMDPNDTVSVAIEPTPGAAAGTLAPAVLADVIRWIALNQPVLIDYWYGRIDTVALARRLQKI